MIAGAGEAGKMGEGGQKEREKKWTADRKGEEKGSTVNCRVDTGEGLGGGIRYGTEREEKEISEES